MNILSRKNLNVFLLLTSMSIMSGCCSKDPIQIQFDDLNPPMTRYKPARADLGPGVIIEGDMSKGKLSNYQVLCRSAYNEKPTSTIIALENLKADSSAEANANIDFLKKFVKENSASFELAKFKNTKNVTIEWDGEKHEYYAKEDWFLDDGTEMVIPKSCRMVIDDLKAKGKFENRVFIITNAISVSKLTYKFDKKMLASMGVDGGVKDAVTAKIGVDITSNSNSELTIDGDRLYIGYGAPLLVKEWFPLGTVAGAIVRITAEPVDLKLVQ